MKCVNRPEKTRREFLHAMSRSAALAALGGIAAVVGLRHNRFAPEDGALQARCERCQVLPICSRPEALHVRDALGVKLEPHKTGRLAAAKRLCEADLKTPPAAISQGSDT